MHKTGTIYGINGPVIYLKGNTGFQMAEMVYVGKERLVGEVIRLTNDITTIQVFEETTGLRPGDPVEATGDAISYDSEDMAAVLEEMVVENMMNVEEDKIRLEPKPEMKP